MNPFDFSRRWISFFGDFEKHRLEEIGLQVKAGLRKDDRAVADALFEAFGMLSSRLMAFRSDAEQEEVIVAFSQALGMHVEDAVEECVEAMLFSGDYARGEQMCLRFVRERLADEVHMAEHRAEFLVRLGRVEEGESTLIASLGEDAKDAWLYVSLGDVFFSYQPVEALRDLDAADAWFYRGYDKGLANEKDEAGRTLLRRLGQVCVERLRRRACGRLVNAMALFGMGPNSYGQFVNAVRKDGDTAPMLAHLRAIASADENGRGIELLQAVDDAVRHLPQDILDGMSPFEMDAFLPAGKNEQRITAEMRARFGTIRSMQETSDFLNEKDDATGKLRKTVITGERERARKQHKDGKSVWKGFLKYRETVNLEDLFATVGTVRKSGVGKQKSGRTGESRGNAERGR